jgi:hypothetical protein
MTMGQDNSITKNFSNLTDPRRNNRRHKFIDIITIAVCGVICNANSFEPIAKFGRAKQQWLKGGNYEQWQQPHTGPAK